MLVVVVIMMMTMLMMVIIEMIEMIVISISGPWRKRIKGSRCENSADFLVTVSYTSRNVLCSFY